jgi:hypothetical protein
VNIALIGTTGKLLLMKATDNSIPQGRVGFLTSGTEAVFGEISISPKIVDYSDRELPHSISQSETEEDVLLLNFFNNADNHKAGDKNKDKDDDDDLGGSKDKDKDKDKNKDKDNGKDKDKEKEQNKSPQEILDILSNKVKNYNTKPWKVCVTTDKPEDRKRFCADKFNVSPIAQLSCENSFCHTCCSKLVPFGHKINSHNCLKQCDKQTQSISNENSELLWRTECINVPNKEKNIYSYCNHNFFNDEYMKSNCNLDACRLCCATTDRAFKGTSTSIASENQCFLACANKFNLENKINLHK